MKFRPGVVPSGRAVRLDMLRFQRFAQQGIVHQVDLPHRKIVRRFPVAIDQRELLRCQGPWAGALVILCLLRGWLRRCGGRCNCGVPKSVQRFGGDNLFLVGSKHEGRCRRGWARDPESIVLLAAASISKPSQERRSQTASRIAGWCSPIPAVKIKASSPPSVAASLHISPAMRAVKMSMASRARASSLASRSRVSLLIPDNPRRPER